MTPVEDPQNKVLLFKCKHCNSRTNVEKNEKEYCVFRNYIQMEEETNIEAIVNPEVIMDPTLPRTQEVECPECGGKEAVFFNAQSKNPDEAMNLVFVCTNSECQHFWKKSKDLIEEEKGDGDQEMLDIE